jgi:nucleoside recognition membrane protein YjiH
MKCQLFELYWKCMFSEGMWQVLLQLGKKKIMYFSLLSLLVIMCFTVIQHDSSLCEIILMVVCLHLFVVCCFILPCILTSYSNSPQDVHCYCLLQNQSWIVECIWKPWLITIRVVDISGKPRFPNNIRRPGSYFSWTYYAPQKVIERLIVKGSGLESAIYCSELMKI